jgi:hypothetical protein
MIPTPHGALIKRPGTKYIADGYSPWSGGQLVSFIKDGQTDYLLELTPVGIRVFWNGTYQTTIEAELGSADYWHHAQVGLTMTLVSYMGRGAPWELTLTPPGNPPGTWSLTQLTSFAPVPAYFGGGYPALLAPLPIADATHPAREWTWKVTAILQDSVTGRVFESLPYTVNKVVTKSGPPWSYVDVASSYPVYVDKPVTIDWENEAGVPDYQPTGWNAHNVVAYRVYAGRGKTFGYIGETTKTQFVDVGDAPDITRQPPQGENPFLIKNYLGATVRTENPSSVVYYEQRRLFAHSYEAPLGPGFASTSRRSNTIWASKTGEHVNFDTHVFPAMAGDALEVTLAGKLREDIRHMVGMNGLLVLTASTVWQLAGADGNALSASDVNLARVVANIGCTRLAPLEVDDALLFERISTNGVQQLLPAQARTGYVTSDASYSARHLFQEHEYYGLARWTYAKDPDSVVWAVRTDDTLLSCTYVPALGMAAWAQHTVGGPNQFGAAPVKDVCVVRESSRDRVYVKVTRGATQVIERMEAQYETDSPRYYLDGHVLVSPPVSVPSTDTTLTVTGLSHLGGSNIYTYSASTGATSGPHTVSAGELTLPVTDPSVRLSGNTYIFDGVVGYRYNAEIELLDLYVPKTEMKTAQKLVREVVIEVEASRGLWAGETFDELREWQQRTVTDGYGVLQPYTGLVKIPIASTWNRGGRAVLRQTEPLPLTILGVTREVEFGG